MRGSDMGQTINYRTKKINSELVQKLRKINPIPALTIRKNDNQTEREINNIHATVKKMNLMLKQLMDAEANEKVLESNRTYPLEVYSDRVPIYIKIHIRRDRNPINIYMRMDENEDLDEDEG